MEIKYNADLRSEFDLKSSLVESGYFGKSKDNIVVLENFVDLEDLKKIQSFLPTINEWASSGENEYDEDGVTVLYNADYWKDRQCSGDLILKLNKEIYEIVEKYILKMKLYLENKFKVELSSRPPVFIKWPVDTYQEPHADKELPDGGRNSFPNYDINSLIYYNDDFDGGELYYPQYDFEIKPKPGLAVAHPGDRYYLHGVRRITSGLRWTTPSFYTIEKVL